MKELMEQPFEKYEKKLKRVKNSKLLSVQTHIRFHSIHAAFCLYMLHSFMLYYIWSTMVYRTTIQYYPTRWKRQRIAFRDVLNAPKNMEKMDMKSTCTEFSDFYKKSHYSCVWLSVTIFCAKYLVSHITFRPCRVPHQIGCMESRIKLLPLHNHRSIHILTEH